MPKRKLTIRPGVTIMELMAAVVIASIVMFGVGVLLVDGQRGWTTMYDRVNSDVVTDGYFARKRFDAVVRKASGEKLLLDDAGNWMEVYYYADSNSTTTDRYARFYYSYGSEGNGQLNIEYGNWNPGNTDPREVVSTQTICSNVSCCVFKGAGRSAQMILTLDNQEQTATVVSSAVMHN